MKIYFVLDNVRSAFNVGSIFRSADGLGFDIDLIGITPTPVSDIKINKTSLGACESVNWKYFKSIDEWLKNLPKDIFIISAEETDLFNCVNLFDFISQNQQLTCENLYIVLGHEINGVDNEILKISDTIVKIPMNGKKNSLNVANCAGIVGYMIKFKIN